MADAILPHPAFVLPVRVYWEDTDAGGVVYYANYLKFCERARTEWLRGLGVHQQELAAREGLQFVVGHVQVRYVAPARLDDALDVGVALVQAGGASLELLQDVRRRPHGCDDPFSELPLLASMQVRVACVRASDMRPTRMPASVLRQLRDDR